MRMMKKGVLLLAGAFILSSHLAVANSTQTPAQLTSQFFKGSVEVRASSINAFARGCASRDRSRFQFRRHRNLKVTYEALLKDRTNTIRLAGLALGACFQRESTLKVVGPLVDDSDSRVSLEAMTQLAHSEHRAGVVSLSAWLSAHKKICLSAKNSDTERCVFAVYAIGQCAQSEPIGSPQRLQAAKTAVGFLMGVVPKLREVSAVALSFVGTKTERDSLEHLLKAERSGEFKERNSPQVLDSISQIAKKLP